MSEELPTVSVIIAARPGQPQVRAVPASRALDYPADKLEIIVTRGRQPSIQRNRAVSEATGQIIYFLDDDSVPGPGNLRQAVPHFRDPLVKMVGGPNVCPPDAPLLEQVFAVVLGSKLAFGPSRARYTPVGALRITSEKELILCNLLARKADLASLGGFNEALYPNEENALMDQLQQNGGKLLYDPDLVVQRRPRPTLKAFCRMLRTYGRGRAEQFRVHPTPGSALNFVPPAFCLYLAALVLLGAWCIVNGSPCRWAALALIPLALYVVVVALEAVSLSTRAGFKKGLAAAPLVVLSHVLYGYGFWRGLFTSLSGERPLEKEVVLERVL